MLYIIGSGLNDFKDLSLRSYLILKNCDKVYLEGYTCIQKTSKTYKKKVKCVKDDKNCEDDKSDTFEKNGIIDKSDTIDKSIIIDKSDTIDKNDIIDKNDLIDLDDSNGEDSNGDYDSIMMRFNHLFGNKVILANRQLVEEFNEIIEESKKENSKIAFLVIGTPFYATTHDDLYTRALKENVLVKVIHNVSIASVKGCYGLYSYNFGRTISIPYHTSIWKPTSFFDNICINYKNKMHTLCLLDIKTDERRYMSINEAIEHLEYCASELNDESELFKKDVFTQDTKIIAVCRFTRDSEYIVYDTVRNLKKINFGEPLHSIIIPSPELSVVEKEMIELILPIGKPDGILKNYPSKEENIN